ncbi:BlaI/MecI/CopY family transcriptional regulator [Microlunatus soli]|uniref:Predicted transcriptional regulator n=1 Tax=Microlunatus soli TaxID=630515 RepID=A0A1H1Z795_9ACTN|nr:BlaI/MecI/CopY family transcriptional regulator [Microlunatus soli]SDT29651.1 Predicted transcriptional regulator [Microlunatus soli]
MGPLGERHSGRESARRAHGTLEAVVTKLLLDADRPLKASEVRDQLAVRDQDALSYSTVVTILTRLYEKNVLTRERDGRAFRYAPVSDQAGLAARRLNAVLDDMTDRDAVLTRFVSGLSEHDEQLLRQLLDEPNRPES